MPSTMQVRWALIFAATSIANLVSAETVNRGVPEDGSESERIFHGADAESGQFPYAVALYYLDGEGNGLFACTGSIIDKNWILTAGHCAEINGTVQPPDAYFAIVNVNRIASEISVEFESIHVHPNYSEDNIVNDIALMRTTEPIPLDEVSSEEGRPRVARVCLSRCDTKPLKYATAMGWGSNHRGEIPVILQYAKQIIVPDNICAIMVPGFNEDKLCAYGRVKGFQRSGICHGDSGGPLVYRSFDNKDVQIGISSHTLWGCGNPFFPDVYTRISSHVQFIKEVTQVPNLCFN